MLLIRTPMRGYHFNVIHLETGFKVDFIVRKTRLFSKEEFSYHCSSMKL